MTFTVLATGAIAEIIKPGLFEDTAVVQIVKPGRGDYHKEGDTLVVSIAEPKKKGRKQ